MKRLRKFLHLPAAERCLLLRAVVLLGGIRLGLQLVPLSFLLKLLSHRSGKNVLVGPMSMAGGPTVYHVEAFLERAHMTAHMVRMGARHIPCRATCLQQSLVLWWLLDRQGIKSDLRVGVRKEANRFEAHAWIELLGLPLNDSDDVRQRFVPFDSAVVPVE